MNLSQTLLSRIAAASETLGLSKATIGAKMVNDGGLYDRLEAGGGISTRNYERCMAWLDEHAPEAAATHKRK